jgi:hypothetical protein
MPYIRIKERWTMPVKNEHQFRLDVREGFWRDRLDLYVDDELVATGIINMFELKGMTSFIVDEQVFELRWIWSMWTGNPLSIVVMRHGKMLAMYGCEEAADDRKFGG